jgi:hypothetical protein
VTELERKVARLVRNLQIAHDRAERYAAPDTGSPSVVANELRWLAEDLQRLSAEALRLSEWTELGAPRIVWDNGEAAEAARLSRRPEATSGSDPDPVSSGSEER